MRVLLNPKIYSLIYLALMLLGVSSCKKSQCEECTKTIGGVAGNVVIEQRKVCNENEISDLEASSSGTTVWECQ